MDDDYELNEAQQRRWNHLLPSKWGVRGTQKKLREKLETELGLHTGSLKTWLSEFGTGKQSGLRAILPHDDRAEVVL